MEGLLIILFLAMIIIPFIPKGPIGIDNGQPVQSIEKKCPPHKWSHKEEFDQNGELVGWKLVCAHCGPIAPQEQIDRKI